MKRITTGTENFKEFMDKNYYYVDKTILIDDVLSDKVMLYTRPRRFGKTLNMSMLYYFFSNQEKENAYLFDNLNVSKHQHLMIHQNQYPVIFLSLKDMNANTFQSQIYIFANLITSIIDKYADIQDSNFISDRDKNVFQLYSDIHLNINELRMSLKDISSILFKHYHQKVIILIDEYDVPLQSAYQHGYYDEMVDFIRSVFSSALKTNDALERGVLTGCLRISKESIFTGLNNFTVRTIMDVEASDCFGFTQEEIDELLKYYNLMDKHQEMKEWYDGYLFERTEIYNSWSALNYIKKLLNDDHFQAVSFWANTSSNDLVKTYIEYATMTMKEEFERLINGQSITKKIVPELTYREMDFHSIQTMNDNVYSFLLFTGYLKIKSKVNGDHPYTYELVIPNKEVRYIYEDIFMKWFDSYQRKRDSSFIEALIQEDVMKANRLLQDVLQQSISYYDNYENFYHGFMVGFLKANGYTVQSNKESGEGRFDIAVLPYSILDTALIIECKHSSGIKELRIDSAKASEQIIRQKYIEGLIEEGYEHVIGYGISFYKKQCIITKAG
ncbi:AAA family ATPase [Massilimicrobiota timonensis]|uniref:AAA family ATPase n=1 Tax=Massilimicrobiota timonensis TaxID=1776392 RepID=UPI00101C2C90|nr:AAA family ATPase [Massilimicrobiota timonensis]